MRSYREFFSLVVLLGKSMKVGFPEYAPFPDRVTEEQTDLHARCSKILQINYNN